MFFMKANQTMPHIFMTMDQVAQVEIWPCSASLRIHLLVCFINIDCVVPVYQYILSNLERMDGWDVLEDVWCG